MEIITMSEYAKRRGVHRKTIRSRIESGAIPEAALDRSGRYPKIIVEIADRAWARNRDPERALRLGNPNEPVSVSRGTTPDPAKEELEEWETLPDDEETSPAPPDDDQEPDHFLKYKNAKATREELNVRKLEMELAEKEGRLLDADEVRKTIIKLVTETKTALLNIPSKIGPDLLACHDLLELEHKLTEEINEALKNLQRIKVGE